MKVTFATLAIVISLLSLVRDYIMEAIRAVKDVRQSWKPRKRSQQEEQLTEFEKKHFK